MKRQQKWQLKQVAKGRCRTCGRRRSVRSALFCFKHYRAHIERNRLWRLKHKATIGSSNGKLDVA